MKNNHLMLAGLLCVIVGQLKPAIADDTQFKVQSNLRAGVAKVDITPREVRDFEVTGHRRRVTGVRDPLRAGVSTAKWSDAAFKHWIPSTFGHATLGLNAGT